MLLIVAGAARAASTPAGGRLVLLAFPRHRRGFALGLRQTGVPFGGLIAAALLPWLAHLYGWRWSLAAAAGIAAVAVLPLAVARKERAASEELPAPRRPVSLLRDRTVRLLTIWGCLLISGQYALVAFLALDLHKGAGLALVSASVLVAVAQAFGVIGRRRRGLVEVRHRKPPRRPGCSTRRRSYYFSDIPTGMPADARSLENRSSTKQQRSQQLPFKAPQGVEIARFLFTLFPK